MKFYKNSIDSRRVKNRKETPDPFIYKYNGYYYLFSTSEKNIIVSKSHDLINFEYCSESNIKVVIDNEQLKYPYAGEVIYFNGIFYITFSPSGRGHYIFKSNKIEGPYTQLTKNFNEMIDGSFFIDSDEKTYFLRASETGIVIKEFKENLNSIKDLPVFSNSNIIKEAKIGRWNEGPYLLKRYGKYYLTYTGTHFLSDAYRVEYVSGSSLDILKYKDVILLDTSEDFYGLGHSMNFLGPNLDSYYIAYHNMKSGKRYLNISRLEFDNAYNMRVNNPFLNDNEIFERPDFEDFSSTKDYISEKETGDTFSIEYNFKGLNVNLLLDYKNPENYFYIDFKDNKISLNEVKNNKVSQVFSKKFKNIYNFNYYHTFRLQYKDNKAVLYFDNIEIAYNINISLNGGKIGYKNNELKDAYIAFSRYAFGDSDKLINHVDETFTSSYASKTDKYNYNFFIKKDGFYSCYLKNSAEIDANLYIDNILRSKKEGRYVTKNICQVTSDIFFTRGVHSIGLDNINNIDKIIIHKDCCALSNNIYDSLINSNLSEFNVYHNYINTNAGLYFENDRNAILTKGKYKDFEISVEAKVINNPVEDLDLIGLVCLVNNYAKKNEFENCLSFNGYLFGVNNNHLAIYEVAFNHSRLLYEEKNINTNIVFTLKIIKELNKIVFYNGDKKIFSHIIEKDLIDGHVGIYMNHASGLFKHLVIKNKEEK